MQKLLYYILFILSLIIFDTTRLTAQNGHFEPGYFTSDLSGLVFDIFWDNNTMYAAGQFYLNGEFNRIAVAKLEQNVWTEIGSYSDFNENPPEKIIKYNNTLYAANRNSFFRFDETESKWIEVKAPYNDTEQWISGRNIYGIYGLKVIDNKLFIYGDIAMFNNPNLNYCVVWDGTNFSPFGSGFDKPVLTIAGSGSSLYFGGEFRANANGSLPLRGAARWDGFALTEPFHIPDGQKITEMLRIVPNDNNSYDSPVLFIGGMSSITDSQSNTIASNLVVFEGGQIRQPSHNGSPITISGNFTHKMTTDGKDLYLYKANNEFIRVSETTGLDRNVGFGFSPGNQLINVKYHNGMFYMTTSNAASNGNNAAGPILAVSPDGSTWQDFRTNLGKGVYGSISRFFELNGDLYALGFFLGADHTKNIQGLAKFTSEGWEAVPHFPMGTVNVVKVHEGKAYIGGNLSGIGPNREFNHYVEFDGTSFSSSLPASPNNAVSDIEVVGNRIYLSGNFTQIGSTTVSGLALFRNNTVSNLNFTTTGSRNIVDILVEPFDDGGFTNYRIFAAGFFNDANGNTAMDHFAYYNGETWSPLGSFNGFLSGVFRLNGELYVSQLSGNSVLIDGVNQSHFLSRWNGSQWEKVIPTLNFSILRVKEAENGMYIFSYTFSPFGSVGFFNGETIEPLYPSNFTVYANDVHKKDNLLYLGLNGTSDYGDGIAVFNTAAQTTVDSSTPIPNEIQLGQNYPNPFNPTTRIPFTLTKTTEITVEIFSALGQKVDVLLFNKTLSSGSHSIDWNASSFSSGVYFYKLSTSEAVYTGKMILLK